MRILVAGGTGLIGRRLVLQLLETGHEVIVLTRKLKHGAQPGLRYLQWNGRQIDPAVGDLDAIINLAGAGVLDERWTPAYKRQIQESRYNATDACTAFIRQANQKPAVFISASAVGYYGTNCPQLVDESAAAAKDFLALTCAEWEKRAQGTGIRTVILRTGLVMAAEGGAFPRLLQPFKFYAGGYLGNGKQGFPWIHIDDAMRAIIFLLENPAADGPFNVSAPEQLSNRDWSMVMGRVLHKSAGAALPAFVVKTMVGEGAFLLLEGQFAAPKKLLELGFEFKYPQAEAAVRNLLSR